MKHESAVSMHCHANIPCEKHDNWHHLYNYVLSPSTSDAHTGANDIGQSYIVVTKNDPTRHPSLAPEPGQIHQRQLFTKLNRCVELLLVGVLDETELSNDEQDNDEVEVEDVHIHIYPKRGRQQDTSVNCELIDHLIDDETTTAAKRRI